MVAGKAATAITPTSDLHSPREREGMADTKTGRGGREMREGGEGI